MIRYHDVKQLTTAELERGKRDLQASLGLITTGSPAHVPIQAQMRAIDTELSERAGNQQVGGDQCTAQLERGNHGQLERAAQEARQAHSG